MPSKAIMAPSQSDRDNSMVPSDTEAGNMTDLQFITMAPFYSRAGFASPWEWRIDSVLIGFKLEPRKGQLSVIPQYLFELP